jgi:hypothetical protein
MSTLKVSTLQNLSGTEVYTCKAWVNFNGTGTVAIRASGNVSSITDNGTGDYTVNFSNAMPDGNYAVNGNAGFGATSNSSPSFGIGTLATSSARIFINSSTSATGFDYNFVTVAVFR